MNTPPVLEVEDLAVTFKVSAGLGRARHLQAVRGVSFTIAPGEVVGIVGESGSGKSTTARAIIKLEKASAGRITLEGTDITALSERAFRPSRRRVQMVFQDPYSSLDPTMTIGDSIAEPLRTRDALKGAALTRRVEELLALVELNAAHRHRYPHEFSGGQRQRIAIARAMALDPALLICDEAVSALDVSTQNQVINLLIELRQRLGMAYLFVSHDLAVVRNVADRVLVMYLGKVVEEGFTEQVLRNPQHPYTQALLAAVPRPNPAHRLDRKKHLAKGKPRPDEAADGVCIPDSLPACDGRVPIASAGTAAGPRWGCRRLSPGHPGRMMTVLWNLLSRCPVLAIPSGVARDGMPTGVQIIGPTYQDEGVFRVGAAVERLAPLFIDRTTRPQAV